MEPCWQCWLKHCKYLNIVTQHVIGRDQLATLAGLIEDHQGAFDKV